MQIDINPLYEPIFTSKCRYFFCWGGRGRGASHTATNYFLFKITQPAYFRGVMLRSTMTLIITSLWQALLLRLNTAVELGYIDMDDVEINLARHTITYLPTGNTIICKGFRKTTSSSKADMKGLEGCTHAIVEEAEDVFESDFRELSTSLRTNMVDNIQILVLFNPPGKNHWLIKIYFDLNPSKKYPGWFNATQKRGTDELLAIHSTYLDNYTNMNATSIKELEDFGNPQHHTYDPDYYCRSVLGLVSEGKFGRIFLKVKLIRRELYDELPYEEFAGVDFGFNAPTTVSANKHHKGNLYSRQVVHRRGMDDVELAQAIKKSDLRKEAKVYADSAQPQSIRTLQRHGVNALSSIKGADSIEYGYRELLAVNWYICDDSPDFWEEIEEHIWSLDADKKPTDVPEDSHNHLIDATRYAYTMHVSRRGNGGGVSSETGRAEEGGRRESNARLLDAVTREMKQEEDTTMEEATDDFYRELYGEDYER